MLGVIRSNSDLIVRDTGTIKGRGVFAGNAYPPGALVEVSPVSMVEGLWEALPLALRAVVYDWGHLSGSPRQDLHGIALGVGSLFNHSPTPNLVYSADVERLALVFTAAHGIEAGEELTIDYDADVRPGEVGWFNAMGLVPHS